MNWTIKVKDMDGNWVSALGGATTSDTVHRSLCVANAQPVEPLAEVKSCAGAGSVGAGEAFEKAMQFSCDWAKGEGGGAASDHQSIVDEIFDGMSTADTSAGGARLDINYTFQYHSIIRDPAFGPLLQGYEPPGGTRIIPGSCGEHAALFALFVNAQGLAVDFEIMNMTPSFTAPFTWATDIAAAAEDVDGDWAELPLFAGGPVVGGHALWWFNRPVSVAVGGGEHAATSYQGPDGRSTYDPTFGAKGAGKTFPVYISSAVTHYYLTLSSGTTGTWTERSLVSASADRIRWQHVRIDAAGSHLDTIQWPDFPHDHFTVDVTSPQVAGTPFTVTVTARNCNGDPVPSFAGTVTLSQQGGTPGSSGPPNAGVHINGTAITTDDTHPFAPADMGQYAFTVTAYTAQTITKFVASSGGMTAESVAVVVNPGPLDHFSVSAASPQTCGVQFDVEVIAQDEWNNTVENFVGDVALSQVGGTAGTDGPPKAGVHINNTAGTGDDKHTFVAADSGQHTFPVTAYTAQTITRFEASGSGRSGSSNAVVVDAGPLDHFKVTVTSPQQCGVPFDVEVTAQDEWNNTVQSFVGDVTLSQVGGTAGGDGPPKFGVHINNTADAGDDKHTFVPADGGHHAFPVTAYTAETISKLAASGGGRTGDSGPVMIVDPE